MRKTLGVLVLVFGTFSAIPTRAGDATAVKCGTNQDRVWVYDSLTTFDVQLKIRCNETVEIIGRSKGYVKIRTHDGSEGFVADAAIPGLPLLEDTAGKPGDANAPAQTDSLGTLARRVAPHPAAAPALLSDSSNASSSTLSVSQPAPATSAALVNASTSRAGATVPAISPATVRATPATMAPISSAAVSSVAVPTTNVNVQVAPPSPNRMNTAATVTATRPTPSRETATVSAPTSAAASATSSVESFPTVAPNSKPKPVSSAAVRTITSGAKVSSSQLPAAGATPNPPGLNSAPAVVKPPPVINTETSANIFAPSPARETPGIRNVSANADSEEFSDYQPVNESADPACQSYFSAYGLAPSQLKWLAENRKKEFPSLCPAPNPSMVDFVVIFTHDVNAYNPALPTPVHTDRNGFSDFSATVGVDTAALSLSEADKARHQFVWVFLMKRGAFDPSKFSPRRRPQYAQVESNSTGSKAGVKTLEDAFEFAQQQASR